MRTDIVAGAVFPDYELTDHTGKRRNLSDLQGPDPMVLVLSRGGYCPKDLRRAAGQHAIHMERRKESEDSDDRITNSRPFTPVRGRRLQKLTGRGAKPERGDPARRNRQELR